MPSVPNISKEMFEHWIGCSPLGPTVIDQAAHVGRRKQSATSTLRRKISTSNYEVDKLAQLTGGIALHLPSFNYSAF
jgi:hypothetical protein